MTIVIGAPSGVPTFTKSFTAATAITAGEPVFITPSGQVVGQAKLQDWLHVNRISYSGSWSQSLDGNLKIQIVDAGDKFIVCYEPTVPAATQYNLFRMFRINDDLSLSYSSEYSQAESTWNAGSYATYGGFVTYDCYFTGTCGRNNGSGQYYYVFFVAKLDWSTMAASVERVYYGPTTTSAIYNTQELQYTQGTPARQYPNQSPAYSSFPFAKGVATSTYASWLQTGGYGILIDEVAANEKDSSNDRFLRLDGNKYSSGYFIWSGYPAPSSSPVFGSASYVFLSQKYGFFHGFSTQITEYRPTTYNAMAIRRCTSTVTNFLTIGEFFKVQRRGCRPPRTTFNTRQYAFKEVTSALNVVMDYTTGIQFTCYNPQEAITTYTSVRSFVSITANGTPCMLYFLCNSASTAPRNYLVIVSHLLTEIGVATASVSQGASATVRIKGELETGFTGLICGKIAPNVGMAISSTEMAIRAREEIPCH